MRRTPLASLSLVTLLATRSVAQVGTQVDAHQFGGFRLCDTLARVSLLFPVTHDTSSSQADRNASPWGQTEPTLAGVSKVVRVAPGEWIVFETTAPIDSATVWRVRTNSPRYRTAQGYGVGMTVAELLNAGAQLEVLPPIAALYLIADSVVFLVDDGSVHDFWKHYNMRMSDSVAASLLKPHARIKEVLIASECDSDGGHLPHNDNEYSLILLINVAREIPSSSAARVRFPP